MKHLCKITVLRREYYQDLADEYLADPSAVFRIGNGRLFRHPEKKLETTDP